MRVPVRCKRVDIRDLTSTVIKRHSSCYSPPLLYNIRGCNGSGKSSIPLSMHSERSVVLTHFDKDVATYFPDYGIVALGTYRNKTGGLDTFKSNAMTEEILSLLWGNPYVDILMEGVISSTIKGFYKDLFIRLKSTFEREINIILLTPPVEFCIQRVLKRNGGKEINEDLIRGKWRTVNNQYEYFKEAGFNVWRADNSNITRKQTLDWFFKEIQEHSKVYSNY